VITVFEASRRLAVGALALLVAAAPACSSSDRDSAPECPASADEPLGLMLTWQQDPTTTMTIDWHTAPGDVARSSVCLSERGANRWASEVEAVQLAWPYGERTIHRVELTGLRPGTEYRFQAGEFGREYYFRTMPADIDEEPVVFATGGDTQHLQHLLETTNAVALQYDIDFVAWGGDLAYADGGSDDIHLERWQWWFMANMNTLIDDDGRVVPILVAIGNHEVVDGYFYRHTDYEATDTWRAQIAPYFYTFFAFPGQPGYGTLDFGDYMSLIFLDTDHSNPIEGVQTEWLASMLSERGTRGVPHVFPVYHVPAHPSHRDPGGEVETRVRETWVPLFETHGIELAFENHDHTYKRTHPIRGGAVDEEEGIVYIGDGAWGVLTREGDQRDAWYIDQFASQRHAVIVSIQGDRRHVRVVSEHGDEIDQYGEPL
jgi:acid phosphatase type 7